MMKGQMVCLCLKTRGRQFDSASGNNNEKIKFFSKNVYSQLGEDGILETVFPFLNKKIVDLFVESLVLGMEFISLTPSTLSNRGHLRY